VKVIADVLGIAFARRVAGRPPMSSILASYDSREVYYNPEDESKSLIIGIKKMTVGTTTMTKRHGWRLSPARQ
jgi:hypothetical protein